jgi:folate-dependent phosphoribosylglycinamide formyltransferase PurN
MLTATRRARLRVALLSTSRAPGLDYLLERDPGRGPHWELVGFIATDPANRDLARVVDAGIPAATPNIRAFYAGTGARRSDLAARQEFDRHTVALLDELHADLIVTCGYRHILTAPLLEAYPNRIVNIHDSDLPSYPGLHAVRDAVFAGERATRSTVHLVTAEVDGGPPLVRSWAFPTHPLVTDARRWGATDILKAYAYAQREWMMRAAWGPLLAHAIGRFADGQVKLEGSRVRLGGTPGPHTLDPVEPAVRLETALPAAGR